ncbi:potassium channel SKOR-like [Pistacia vera]|uniref:potassium channel SKOR-like n=1 Tax=Pistacia vera TaxID=55513 RepID=UPI001262DD3E|nr:potassium channel SKOR-like [Pistacia vera]
MPAVGCHLQGYGDIHAVNAREMIFIMIFVSFDMLLGAYLLGNMTALVVKGSNTERFRDKMTDIIKYMNRNNLENQLSNRIKDHLRLLYDSHRDHESQVLQDIPPSIRTKISYKLYEPCIKDTSIFRGCSSGFIKQIAIKVHEEIFLPGEVVIERGNITDQLYIVYHGDLDEVQKGEDEEEEDEDEEDEEEESTVKSVQSCNSFGEVSFLCNIRQPSTITARELSRVLLLDKISFMQILDIYFSDGHIILENLLEEKDANLRNKILQSDFTLYMEKHESEIATRLNCAVSEGDFPRLKRLIGAGADPNKTDYDGRSPLHIAASRGYEDMTVFLIEKGVGINISDKSGNTPLLEAVKNGHDQIASLLSNAGASLIVDDAGDFLCKIVARKDLDLLKRVLAHGTNPNSKNYDHRTPLHIAAAEGLLSFAKLLIETGASVFVKDRWGNIPLDESRINGDKNMMKLLEVARTSQMFEFSICHQKIQDKLQRRKCTVFSFHPYDLKERERRKEGIVLWVPETMEELIGEAKEKLKCAGGSCILSENGGKILDINMISDEQKVFLVTEELAE